jgi:hypothetical protein
MAAVGTAAVLSYLWIMFAILIYCDVPILN